MQRRSQARVTGSQPPPGGPAMVPAVAHLWLISSKSRQKTETGGPYARGVGGRLEGVGLPPGWPIPALVPSRHPLTPTAGPAAPPLGSLPLPKQRGRVPKP